MMQQSPPSTSWLDTKQAAELLGFSQSTIANSRYTGLLGGVTAPKFRKMGKSIRYEQSTLNTWRSQFKEQVSTSESAA